MLKPAPPKGLLGIIWEGAPGAAAAAPNMPGCGAPNAAGSGAPPNGAVAWAPNAGAPPPKAAPKPLGCC